MYTVGTRVLVTNAVPSTTEQPLPPHYLDTFHQQYVYIFLLLFLEKPNLRLICCY